MRNLAIRAVFIVLASLMLAPGNPASAQIQVDVIGRTGTIPRANYRSWSLFLVCNPGWLLPEQSSALYNLYAQYKSFGRVIGDDNAAVWFWKSETSSTDPHLADKVDVERSAEFCKAFGIKPSSSPAILVTTDYPDFERPTPNRVVVELAKMRSGEISSLLAQISDQLLLKGRITQPLPASDGQPGGVLGRFMQALQDTLRDAACNWTFTVRPIPTFEIRSNWCNK
jgi:hypothetical protein